MTSRPLSSKSPKTKPPPDAVNQEIPSTPVRHIVRNGEVISPARLESWQQRQDEIAARPIPWNPITNRKPTSEPAKLPCGHHSQSTPAEHTAFLAGQIVLRCQECRRYFAFLDNEALGTAVRSADTGHLGTSAGESHVTPRTAQQGGHRLTVGEHNSGIAFPRKTRL